SAAEMVSVVGVFLPPGANGLADYRGGAAREQANLRPPKVDAMSEDLGIVGVKFRKVFASRAVFQGAFGVRWNFRGVIANINRFVAHRSSNPRLTSPSSPLRRQSTAPSPRRPFGAP